MIWKRTSTNSRSRGFRSTAGAAARRVQFDYLLFRSIDEWSKLAAWFTEHKVFSHTVRYLIQVPAAAHWAAALSVLQVPRLYNIYKSIGAVDSFADVMKNLFEPLFEVKSRCQRRVQQ